MENVHAAISTPSPVPAKTAAPETPGDADAAPLPGAFLAVLSHQVKNLKAAPVLDAQATDAKATDADPGLAATDPTLAAEPAAIDLQLLVGLPPAAPPAAPPTASDAATTAPATDTASAAASAAAAASTIAAAAASAVALAATSVAVSAIAAPVVSAVAAAAAPAVAATAVSAPAASLPLSPASRRAQGPNLPPSTADAKPAAAAASGSAQDAARKSITDDTPAPRAIPARDAVAASTTASLAAAHGELLRAADGTPSLGADGREKNAPAVPQLAFTQVLSEARAASAVAPAAQLQVDTQVGTAGWGTELGQKVVWMVNEKQQVAELRVNPPDLGPLDIKLTIDDHQTTAVFTSPHSSVRDAVESALPRLREVLAESGIMLGNASVTSDSPRDGAAFAQPPARSLAARDEAANDAALRLAPGAGGTMRGRGLVDLFA